MGTQAVEKWKESDGLGVWIKIRGLADFQNAKFLRFLKFNYRVWPGC